MKIQAFIEKTHVCFEENPNFQRFEESKSKRQMCYKNGEKDEKTSTRIIGKRRGKLFAVSG